MHPAHALPATVRFADRSGARGGPAEKLKTRECPTPIKQIAYVGSILSEQKRSRAGFKWMEPNVMLENTSRMPNPKARFGSSDGTPLIECPVAGGVQRKSLQNIADVYFNVELTNHKSL